MESFHQFTVVGTVAVIFPQLPDVESLQISRVRYKLPSQSH